MSNGMDAQQEIVPQDDIDAVWGNANFGGYSRRNVIDLGVLKCASGYYQGHTSTQIITELGLVDKEYKLTPKGRAYLWAAFNNGSNF
jgi:hypothetical protein